jgi:hypothetical protein
VLTNIDISPDAIISSDKEYALKPTEYKSCNEYKISKTIIASFDVGFVSNLTFLKDVTTPILLCDERSNKLMPCAATSQNIDKVGMYGNDALKTISLSFFFSIIELININGGLCGSLKWVI